MPRNKGKKKKQQQDVPEESGTSQQQREPDPSRQRQQAPAPSQQQQVPAPASQKQQVPTSSQREQAAAPSSSQSLQGVWAARKQQQETAVSLQQQQPQQRQQGQGPIQQHAPQQQSVPQLQQMQQSPQRLQQQQSQMPPQQQQQPQWQQQQRPQGPQQQQQQPQWQQRPQGPPQQQQQQPQWSQQRPQGPPQQQQQPQWPQQQQRPQGPPQQQQQPQWPQQQQQRPQGPLQQQQQPQWPQQQLRPQGPPQQQQQLQWPQQQRPQGPPQQQQQPQWPQQQQQQRPQGPPQQQQQRPQGPPQQQQQQPGPSKQQEYRAPIGPSGDHRPTGSVQQQMSQLSLRDPLESISVAEKQKVSSSALKQYQLAIPRRKDPSKAGTAGRPTSVWTNMFQLIFDKKFVTNAVHYDVNITPIAPKSLYRLVFEKCRSDHFRNRYPAFDGKKNAYSANALPFNEFMQAEIEIHDAEREQVRKFKIELKRVANIDLSWIKNLRPGIDEADRDQTGIQVLDIIMRHAPQLRTTPIGKSFFWNFTNANSLGEGFCLMQGGFQSAVLGWKPYLNVDVSHKGFPKAQSVIDLMAELMEIEPENLLGRNLKVYEVDTITRYLKGLKVNYQILNQPRTKRTYRVNSLGESASRCTFDHDDGKITVERYFSAYKNCPLRYPNLPVLKVGSREKQISLPAELCSIVAGQNVTRKLSANQTREMIRQTVKSAPIRKDNIAAAFDTIAVNNSPVMSNEFHLSVSAEMKQVAARVLPAPDLKYAVKTVKVNRGTWFPDIFNRAMNLENGSWTILDLSRPVIKSPDVQNFVTELTKTGKEVGMMIGNPQSPFKYLDSGNIRGIEKYFKENKNLKLVIVIISENSDIYGKVKQITELNVGLLTQCIKARNVWRVNKATVKNILLKINSKLNGVNHTFNEMPSCLKNNSCMLVGADVTHPSPDATNIPSIAAVAASRNPTAFQYNIELRLQQPKEEIIADLENIIISQIMIYKKLNDRMPTGIIYYRDGVSEGQLAYVMHHELHAIRQACARCRIKIPLTCMIVQKRHHIRFFPVNPRDSDDRNGNVKAGTIVDTEITHPNHIDFYLVSHASIQGTARPTKYRCICNESNYNENQLEELTYYLCHIYARCTRSVSYPAPTYYAHLAAYRGRALIQDVDISLNNLPEEQGKLRMNMAKSPMCFV